jgi:hypothetical protein
MRSQSQGDARHARARRGEPLSRRSAVLTVAAALLVVVAGSTRAGAQVFLASHPHPVLQVGPLFLRATVSPALGPITVDLFWSFVVPAGQTGDFDQEFFFLWPGAVTGDKTLGAPDATLARYVEDRGFHVVGQGRLVLSSRPVYGARAERERTREAVAGGAPFVTFVREGGDLGPSSPATLVKIPWTPKLVNPIYMVNLRLPTPDLVKHKAGTWVEHTFWGPRHRLSLSFHEVRARAMFPMYLQHRDRVLRLADEPAQISVDFADADHLKIDELYPQSIRRQASETRRNTETVALFLDRSEGLTPQTLTVQFGYFRGVQSWAPILIPALAFLLGNLAGPIVREGFKRGSRVFAARVHLGRGRDGDVARDEGVVVPRETLARIVPGQTTYEEVVKLLGPNFEQLEQLAAPDRRTLVYRGRRISPERRRQLGWFATVSHWTQEQHEAEIEIEGDRVRDVQARVRRSRLASPESA